VSAFYHLSLIHQNLSSCIRRNDQLGASQSLPTPTPASFGDGGFAPSFEDASDQSTVVPEEFVSASGSEAGTSPSTSSVLTIVDASEESVTRSLQNDKLPHAATEQTSSFDAFLPSQTTIDATLSATDDVTSSESTIPDWTVTAPAIANNITPFEFIVPPNWTANTLSADPPSFDWQSQDDGLSWNWSPSDSAQNPLGTYLPTPEQNPACASFPSQDHYEPAVFPQNGVINSESSGLNVHSMHRAQYPIADTTYAPVDPRQAHVNSNFGAGQMLNAYQPHSNAPSYDNFHMHTPYRPDMSTNALGTQDESTTSQSFPSSSTQLAVYPPRNTQYTPTTGRKRTRSGDDDPQNFSKRARPMMSIYHENYMNNPSLPQANYPQSIAQLNSMSTPPLNFSLQNVSRNVVHPQLQHNVVASQQRVSYLNDSDL